MSPKTSTAGGQATGGKPSTETQATEKGLIVQAAIIGGIVVVVFLLIFFGVI